MKLVERLRLALLEFHLWFKQVRTTILIITAIVLGAGIITFSMAPQIHYETMISILTALIELAGVLIAFTAVVAVQVLSAYRSQLERAGGDSEEVLSRRKTALSNIRSGIFLLSAGVLIAVVIMAWLNPGNYYYSFPLFFVAYTIIAGIAILLLIVEDL